MATVDAGFAEIAGQLGSLKEQSAAFLATVVA